jgi:hypothetical protein
MEGVMAMLEWQHRCRAISFYDGGRLGGDAVRAKISIRTRFVLSIRGGVRIAVAGAFAIFLVAKATVSVSVASSAEGLVNFVSSSSEHCATSVRTAAGNGSEAASRGAKGSGSLFQTSPGAPLPVNRGELG